MAMRMFQPDVLWGDENPRGRTGGGAGSPNLAPTPSAGMPWSNPAPNAPSSTFTPSLFNYGDPSLDKGQVGRLGRIQGGEERLRGATSSFLYPWYEKYATGEGYSPEDKNAILQESLGGISGAYGSLRDRLTNRVARTRNSAGYGAAMTEATRSESRDRASAGRQAQLFFADEKARRNELGAQGLAQLFGVNTSFLGNLLAQSTGIQAGRESRKKGLFDWLNLAKGIGEDVAKAFSVGGFGQPQSGGGR